MRQAVRERDLARAVLDLLAWRGAWSVRTHGRLGNLVPDRPGVPDVVACYRGRFLALELKSPTGRLSAQQEQELAAVRRAGGVAHVVRDVDDVLKLLDELDQEARG